MFTWLHIILVVALLVFLFLDLRRKGGYRPYVFAIRTIYILFILDGLWLYPLAWMRTPLLAYFKVIASILVICFLEYLVVQRFKNQLSKLDIWLGVILLLALIILGLATAQWGPWVNL
ncbi:DUF1516 family protein [Acetilactobacillus jinshanensis]|uniref:DUF1516 family protein n=1 Tax=Acetilactobacillus jinshanensis TaxID=1720083 RepID=A0A4P6ZMV2_9LACO|nr:DUF1516 family protein [Acetilactobacillus jinshanensis]QBP18963.1 DUF1516 family protein [Acetilactobacillus jinshanensis]URL60489.1 DUF1516 family protein [uncultured bacterium]